MMSLQKCQIVKSLEDSGLLVKDVTKTTENKTKE